MKWARGGEYKGIIWAYLEGQERVKEWTDDPNHPLHFTSLLLFLWFFSCIPWFSTFLSSCHFSWSHSSNLLAGVSILLGALAEVILDTQWEREPEDEEAVVGSGANVQP